MDYRNDLVVGVSMNRTSEKPQGSKFLEVPVGAKGMGSGPSPPTYPLAKALIAVLTLLWLAGAKAAAEAARVAAMVSFMVCIQIKLLSV